MPKRKYYYNPRTLRFERSGISIVKFLMTGLGYLSFGAVFFVSLLLLQAYVTTSPKEKALRAENRALKNHQEIINGKIKNANVVLASLRSKDADLYQKIFETAKPVTETFEDNKEDILTASPEAFDNWTSALSQRFDLLANKASYTNLYFSWTASVDRDDLRQLKATPSLIPVENFEVKHLVSGYGQRINPFHKGRYHHDGIDIAAPRGSNVIAAAPGRVILVKQSDLLAGFGNYIEVDHGHGYVTRYSHLETTNVKWGQTVTAGQVIGTVGKSGGAIAPHLHYEVLLKGETVDPVKFFISGVNSAVYHELLVASLKINQSLD